MTIHDPKQEFDREEDPWPVVRSMALMLGFIVCTVLTVNSTFFEGPITKGIAMWSAATLTMSVVFSVILARHPSNRERRALGNLIWTLTAGFAWTLPLSALILVNILRIPPSVPTAYAISAIGILALSQWIGIRFMRNKTARARSLIGLQTLLAPLIVAFAIFWTNSEAERAFASLPETLPARPGPCSDISNSLFVHISDLHLVGEKFKVTYDGSQPGNSYLPDMLSPIVKTNPAALLISGDITDRGFVDQWSNATRSLSPIATHVPVIFAPGNHDLSNAFEGNLTDVTPETRLQRFVRAQAELSGRLMTAMDSTLEQVVENAPTFEDPAYREAEARLQDCRQKCEAFPLPRLSISPTPTDPVDKLNNSMRETIRRRGECAAGCDARLGAESALVKNHIAQYHTYWKQVEEHAFPLYWLDASKGLAVFSLMLQSQGGQNGLGNNAIGYLDQAQMQRLKNKIDLLSPAFDTVVVMAHHPLTRAPNDSMQLPGMFRRNPGSFFDDLYSSQWWNYAFLRSDPIGVGDLVRWLRDAAERQTNRSFVVAFGHRHQRSLGSFGKVIVMEAPNLSARKEQGFYLASRPNPGALSISWCTR